MNELLSLVLNQQNKSNINDIAQQFGIDSSQVQRAISEIVPGMTQELKHRVQEPQRNHELVKKLEQNEYSQFIDDENTRLTEQSAQVEGESLLSQIFGNDESERRSQLTETAAQKTGLDSGIISQMLPMLAPMLMGSLGKQVQHSSGGIMGLMNSLGGLDSDGDGRPDANGIIGKLMSFFKR